MKLTRTAFLLLVPAITVFAVLLVLPLGGILGESFKLFVPGRVGSAADAPYTLANYLELFKPTYFSYFLTTFRLGGIAAVMALAVGYPIAYYVARTRSMRIRNVAIALLITMMFLSALVRVYSLELTFGSVGAMMPVLRFFEVSTNSRTYIQWLVVAGLLHFIIPMAALTLIGTIQNVNPRLVEAAQTLGAMRWKAHLTITVPLSVRGILSAFLICYTLCISAFVVPMVLGKGKVLFVSNLIYRRFSEVANYPSGSAISITLLVVSLAIVYVVSRVASQRW